MRLYVVIFAVAICFFCLAEAGKKERRRKKLTEKLARLDLAENLNRDKNDEDEILSTDGDDEDKMDNQYGPRYNKKYKKNKHGKKGKFDHKNQMAWLNVKTGSECEIECKHKKEVCIVGPIDSKPICVNKKDLKKSLKLFYRFQKKEMKAWKEFKKEKYNHEANNRYPFDIEENGQDLNVDNKNLQVVKQNNSNQLKEESQVQNYGPSKPEADPEVCTTAQFSQMRTRMMGWFHLLHGQDHDARKASGKSIKHFYKHFSVKKELRQSDGFKCECLKSAIWQFLQMDKNGDDSLSDAEMSILEENSLEPCMRPYLTSCDQNADQKLSSDEWCCCFSNVVAPCFKKVDDIRKSGESVAYMPRCDKEGYYLREQCEGEKDKEFKCWCVDYNGNELGGTRTNGRAHCSKLAINDSQKVMV